MKISTNGRFLDAESRKHLYPNQRLANMFEQENFFLPEIIPVSAFHLLLLLRTASHSQKIHRYQTAAAEIIPVSAIHLRTASQFQKIQHYQAAFK